VLASAWKLVASGIMLKGRGAAETTGENRRNKKVNT
jgi:hypothetical protein